MCKHEDFGKLIGAHLHCVASLHLMHALGGSVSQSYYRVSRETLHPVVRTRSKAVIYIENVRWPAVLFYWFERIQ